MDSITSESEARPPWLLLKQKEIWAIRIRLQLAQRTEILLCSIMLSTSRGPGRDLSFLEARVTYDAKEPTQ